MMKLFVGLKRSKFLFIRARIFTRLFTINVMLNCTHFNNIDASVPDNNQL
jgi:hypothetical protein